MRKAIMGLVVGLGLVAAVGSQAQAAPVGPPRGGFHRDYGGWHGGWHGGGWHGGYVGPRYGYGYGRGVWIPGYWAFRPWGRVWVEGYWR